MGKGRTTFPCFSGGFNKQAVGVSSNSRLEFQGCGGEAVAVFGGRQEKEKGVGRKQEEKREERSTRGLAGFAIRMLRPGAEPPLDGL